MTTLRTMRLLALAVATGAAAAPAQQPDVRALLAARGLPPDLVTGVAAVATDAATRGLPTGPIADKALEGWAKRAPAERILTVVQAFTQRMGDAQVALRGAGVAAPPGDVIAAAADAMGRGMTPAQVGAVVRAGPSAAEAAPALHVAAVLSSQGMEMDQAVTVVSTAMRDGRPGDQILDMPSVMRAMQAQGMAPTEIGRQLMEGRGGPRRGGPGSIGPGGSGPGGPGGGMQRPGGNRGPGSGGNRPPGEMPPPPPPGGGRGPN
jgi:hypothetical protein